MDMLLKLIFSVHFNDAQYLNHILQKMMTQFLLSFHLISVTYGQYDITDWSNAQLFEAIGQFLQLRDGDVTESDVNCYLYSRNNPDEPIWLNHHENYTVDKRKSSKVIIHGFLESYRADCLREMKDEFLKLDDYNVILADWNRVAKSYYVSAARNTALVGDIIGKTIFDHGLPSSSLHFIGFSLGAHIAAFAAKKMKKLTGDQIQRITALDPAGPYFRMESISEDERLNAKDAKIVDAFHTDGGFFGYLMPIGTLDVYVNKGVRRQPGCFDGEASLNRKQLIINSMCSHKRACTIFTESILMANITCNLCDNFETMRTDSCGGDNNIIIVNQKVTEHMQGICVFFTTD